MPNMNYEIYDALKSAQGVTDDQAKRAAEAVLKYDDRFYDLKSSIDALRADMKLGFEASDRKFDAMRADMKLGFSEVDVKFSKIEGRINLLNWILVFLMTGVAGILIKSYVNFG